MAGFGPFTLYNLSDLVSLGDGPVSGMISDIPRRQLEAGGPSTVLRTGSRHEAGGESREEG